MMCWWAAESFTKSYENNRDKVRLKIKTVKADIILLVAQAVTLVLGLTLIGSD